MLRHRAAFVHQWKVKAVELLHNGQCCHSLLSTLNLRSGVQLGYDPMISSDWPDFRPDVNLRPQ